MLKKPRVVLSSFPIVLCAGVTNNDVLRRLRYSLDFGDQAMMGLFAAGGREVSRQEVSAWLKRDEDPAFEPCADELLSSFLNGLIVHFRGAQDGPPRAPEGRLTNNLILRKLKIALELKDTDMLELLRSADMVIGKPELSALFRKPDHKHYRECQDQLLRRFLTGLARSRASKQSEPS